MNLPKEQEKRCLTVSEVIALIQKYAPKGDTLPEVTALDNEKVLEVIAGAWGKGGKKVSIMRVPSSTNPLPEQDAYTITEGTFINGEFLSFKNPILTPSTDLDSDTFHNGFIIGVNSDKIPAIASYYMDENRVIVNNGTILDYSGVFGTRLYNVSTINNRSKPQIEVALTNLGTITSTETATGSGFYKNEIPYTAGIGNEDIINVKMSNGAVYQAINDTTNSQLVVYTAVDFATNSISVSKCWKLAY